MYKSMKKTPRVLRKVERAFLIALVAEQMMVTREYVRKIEMDENMQSDLAIKIRAHLKRKQSEMSTLYINGSD